VKVALPVATAEGFGGIADFPDKLAIKCACDCWAITDELMMLAEATNKVIATVAKATTDGLIFIEATTADEYLSFAQIIGSMVHSIDCTYDYCITTKKMQ